MKALSNILKVKVGLMLYILRFITMLSGISEHLTLLKVTPILLKTLQYSVTWMKQREGYMLESTLQVIYLTSA